MEEEIWKDIKDYEGYYQVSDKGRVRSLDRYIIKSNGVTEFKRGVIIQIQFNSKNGRPEVSLRKEGKRKCKKVYRLVAEQFVENDNPKVKTCVNHLDGDVTNCCANNLEWVDYSENLKHSYDVLKRPVNVAKVKRREVIAINNGEVMVYPSIESASRSTGISCTQIRRNARGDSQSKKDYIFRIPSLDVEDIERVVND